MTNPIITSISFDKSLYSPGDTITATVTYTSSNDHGGVGTVGYDLSFSLTDELTSDTNSGASGQSGEFFVSSGTSAPNPVEILASAALAPVALSVSSLTSGASNTQTVASGTTSSVTVAPNALALLCVYPDVQGVSSVSGLGLTGSDVSGEGFLWTASAPGAGASGDVTVGFAGNTGYAYDLVQVTGQNPSTPWVASNIQGASNIPSVGPSLTFNAAASSDNLFLAMWGTEYTTGYGGFSTPSGYTAVGSASALYSGETVVVETQISDASTDTTCSPTYYGSSRWYGVGLELNAFQTGAGIAPADWTLVFNNLASDGTGTAVFEAVAS